MVATEDHLQIVGWESRTKKERPEIEFQFG